MQLLIHPTQNKALTFSHDAATLSNWTGTLTRWSLTTNPATKLAQRSGEGRYAFLPTGVLSIVNGITAVPDERLFALARCSSPTALPTSMDRLELLQWHDFASVGTTIFPGEDISGLVASPDGRWFVMASALSERIFLLDRLSGQVSSEHVGTGQVTTNLTFDPTSRFVAGIVINQGGACLTIWRLDQALHFVPRKGEIVMGEERVPLDQVHGTMALFTVHESLNQTDIPPPYTSHQRMLQDTIGTVAFSWDSRIVIFSLAYDGINSLLVAYEVSSGKLLWATHKPGSGVEPFVLTRDGEAVICSSGGTTQNWEKNIRSGSNDLLIYRVEDGTLLQRVSSVTSEPIEAVAWNHDGTTLWLATQETLVAYPFPSLQYANTGGDESAGWSR